MIDERRVHVLRGGTPKPGPQRPVVYWMHRDHRARDNFGLLHAQAVALRHEAPLIVVYCLVPQFLEATIRQFGFLLRGLEQTAHALRDKRIPFVMRRGDPPGEVARYVREVDAALLVTDFDTLRIKRQWLRQTTEAVSVPVHEVDSRNVVPCRVASDKREYAARTIRPKIHRLLPEFLHEPPSLAPHPHTFSQTVDPVDWSALREGLQVDRSVPEVTWLTPGEDAAAGVLGAFIQHRLDRYDEARNDPNEDVTSNLSPYLHFGQLAGVRAALAVAAATSRVSHAREAFLEELVVRREICDNYCLHTPDYDAVSAFPDWARQTLDDHRADRREHLYDLETLERGATHDELWNAAQLEMTRAGKMHNYMRMYWAKKMLEWTESPEQALEWTIFLNDRHELDGRDPNGYVGAAWSIGGVHDRAWKERPIFGKIRYMSYNGAKSKFSIKGYVAKVDALQPV